ncbi:hypothetical protein L484_027122 [Morus notabilis]|uniref:Uncharacterized protein n=1 Tax=Morus notabilis TaxID=981085 RepID=W9SBL0_9ROSA|nr:hypothetical protein L484_027122 [Morus notabilis]
MIYSYSVASPSSFFAPSLKRNIHQSIQPIRGQSYRDRDQGSRSSNNIVDANLSVLSERMEKIKVKERLERCCRSDIYGWNYLAVTSTENKNYRLVKRKRSDHQSLLTELLEFAAIAGGALGFTFFTGTFFLCLVSLFVHLNQIM